MRNESYVDEASEEVSQLRTRIVAAVVLALMTVGVGVVEAYRISGVGASQAIATEGDTETDTSVIPPETTVPETTVPEATVPETTVPQESTPEVTVPETTTTMPLPTTYDANRCVYPRQLPGETIPPNGALSLFVPRWGQETHVDVVDDVYFAGKTTPGSRLMVWVGANPPADVALWNDFSSALNAEGFFDFVPPVSYGAGVNDIAVVTISPEGSVGRVDSQVIAHVGFTCW